MVAHTLPYMGGIGGMRYLIESGGGVGVLPLYFAKDDLAKGALIRLLPDQPLLTDTFRLVWRAGHPWEDRLIELAGALRGRPLF